MVRDMGRKADLRPSKVGAVAQSGERRGKDIVSPCAQQPSDLFPTPASEPGRVHEDERRHEAPTSTEY
jgi:hypothetical protein